MLDWLRRHWFPLGGGAIRIFKNILNPFKFGKRGDK